jgi:UDP-N-acetylmuramyl pentapeptide phosphotransferase/UDP-N-acetylglucosamine-1-phosphate transferase
MPELSVLKSGALPAAVFLPAGWLAGRLILRGTITIICDAGFLKANYMGEEIPTGAGVVLFLSALAVVSVSFLCLPDVLKQEAVIFLLAMAGYTCLGLMDDFWGSGSCRGLAGHMKKLMGGRMTTGSLKAMAGGAIALFVSSTYGPWALIPLNTLLLALSVNMINLLDLRPGRAGKCYLALAVIFAALFPSRPEMAFTALTAGSLLAYLPLDLKARAMMGDAGANALGAALGLTAIWLFDVRTKLLYLAALLLLHAVAEKYSLTRIIASNRMLDYLDKLGRSKIRSKIRDGS